MSTKPNKTWLFVTFYPEPASRQCCRWPYRLQGDAERRYRLLLPRFIWGMSVFGNLEDGAAAIRATPVRRAV
jgi:hypothetical protein